MTLRGSSTFVTQQRRMERHTFSNFMFLWRCLSSTVNSQEDERQNFSGSWQEFLQLDGKGR